MRTPRSLNRIVFLDAGTLDFGDLSLSPLRAFGGFRAYTATSASMTAQRIKFAEQVVVNKCILSRSHIESAERLKAIHVAATGVNNIDLQAARERGITVTNAAGYSTESVVQLTFSFLLAMAVNLVKYDSALKRGLWSRSRFFMWPGFPVREIFGKTLGIIGCGRIGRRVAETARAFGLSVLIAKIPGRSYPGEKGRVSLDRVLRESDFLTIHTPLTELTRGLIGGRELRKMKPGSVLMNMARGGIVDETELLKALKSGRLAGAATDVLVHEPPRKTEPLLKHPNLLAMPHMGWASLESRRRLLQEIVFNIRAFQSGKKRNCIVS